MTINFKFNNLNQKFHYNISTIKLINLFGKYVM